jgi:hypothetical protein
MVRVHVVTPESNNNAPIDPEGSSLTLFAVTLIFSDALDRNEKEGLGQVLKRYSLTERFKKK